MMLVTYLSPPEAHKRIVRVLNSLREHLRIHAVLLLLDITHELAYCSLHGGTGHAHEVIADSTASDKATGGSCVAPTHRLCGWCARRTRARSCHVIITCSTKTMLMLMMMMMRDNAMRK